MTAARRASTGAAHGARSHNHIPSCSPPPDYRLAALRVKDACGAATPAGLRPVLDPHGPLTRIGSSRETGNARPPGRPRASPACR